MPPKLRRRSTGAALSHAASGEEAPKSSETTPAPAAAASGRWTRSRSARSHLGLDSTEHPRVSDSAVVVVGGGRTDDPDQAPARAAPKKSESAAAAGPVPKKKKTTAVGASTRLASRPLPGRYPDYPDLQPGQNALSNKYMSAVENWMTECSRISKLEKQAHHKNIPTLRDEPKDPRTADAVVSSQDKAMVRRVACSVVGVKTQKPDGELVSQCTGIVVGLDGVNKCAKILTAASLVCDFEGELHDPTLMLSVHLPNKVVTEGRLLHFNVHYGVALLEILGDFQLQVPSFGLSTNYGEDVFVLARDESMSLMVRHGKISWLHYPMLWNNHCMFLSCDIPQGASGGPVIDHDGKFIAIALDNNPSPVVIPVSTIRTCIDMWLQFSRVARPILGMQLEAVELLDVSRQEELCRDYNVTDGFIVNQVNVHSTAETLGIRRGDVIVFQDTDSCTSPQLEDYLLSLGWGYLQGISLTADLKVEVHNLMDSYRESITFPLQFSDASRRVD